MAISQARIIESLEQACSGLNRDEFIFSFLDAYGFPKSTITRLRNNGDSRNVGEGDDIALRKQVYFKLTDAGTDLSEAADRLKASQVVLRNDIRFVIVTDLEAMEAYDLKADERLEITLEELPRQYAFFLPLAGYEKAIMYAEHPADVRASEKMGQLFDLIRQGNDLNSKEDVHALNVFLTRLLFCFYAEDTDIFRSGQLTAAIQSVTSDDGSDLAGFFTDLFSVLNLPDSSAERQRQPAHFQAFPYVNGGLFREFHAAPDFSRKARRLVLECGALDWSAINPDIFGSMFQAVIDEDQRGNLGQHYTSVSNIMKVIQPLFLDRLYADLDKAKSSDKKLKALLVRLQTLRIFDPACGSGNFLIIAYKELRKFEMEVIGAFNKVSTQQQMHYSGIRLSQFHGIELDDFAHEIAILSLWLAEHQMNMAFKATFGYAKPNLPLRDSGHIVHGNSLRLNWKAVCPTHNEQGDALEVYICGNPPFLGTTERSDDQSSDMKYVLSTFKSIGYLDLVSAWFWLGARYLQGNNAQCAFVTTNSICQGDQASLLWPKVFERDISISFCYKTFPWSNNAKNKAAVHVAIVGLKNRSDASVRPTIYEVKNNSVASLAVNNISPYLIPGTDLVVYPTTSPITRTPRMAKGSQPTDGGHLYITTEDKDSFVTKYPEKAHWIRQILGAREFLNGGQRWCLWLVGIELDEVMSVPEIAVRCENIRALRIKAGHTAALRGAERPHTFLQVAQPKEGNYLLVPRVSSERRPYIPIGYFDINVIASDANMIIPNASRYEFGILTSEMHNDWMRTVAGRLKSDYRYSATLVYNTFPWPDATESQRDQIKRLAEEVLLVREDYPDKTLSDLYDPNKMPEPLRRAHKALDRAVEGLYRSKPFSDATERLECLFTRYEKLIAAEKAAGRKKTKGDH